MTIETNDPLFETFYTAFLMQMKQGGEKPAVLPTALAQSPKNTENGHLSDGARGSSL